MTLDDLANLDVGRRLPRECAVTYAIRILPPDRAAVFRRAAENPSAPAAEVARQLMPELPPGADPVTEFSIRRHRKPEHRCGTP